MTAACVDQWALFDSTHLADHAEARAICDACPVFAWCREQALEIRGASYGGRSPDGTWAGQLWRDGRVVAGPVAARGAA